MNNKPLSPLTKHIHINLFIIYYVINNILVTTSISTIYSLKKNINFKLRKKKNFRIVPKKWIMLFFF